MNLRTKLVLALVGCTWAVSAIVGVLSYRATASGLLDEIDRSVQAAVESVLGGPGATARGQLARLVVPREVDLQVLEPDGQVRFASAEETIPVGAVDLELAGTAAQGATVSRDGEVGGASARVVTTSLGGGRGAVMGARSTEEVERVLAALRTRILVVSVVVAAVAGLLGALLARSITSRLTRLTAAAERVATSGELRVDIPRDGHDETARLGSAFDDMLSALALSSEQQRRLVQDAGHELRTPMTSLRTNLYSLRSVDDLDEGTVREVVADLESEAEELTRLMEDVLSAAGGSDAAEAPEPVDLAELARSESLRVANRWDRTVVVAPGHPVEVLCRRSQMARAIRNLVDNACKFSPPGTEVQVAVASVPGGADGRAGASIEVSDHGPGIEPAELSLVFDRFHRSEAARSLPGSGLGLSIVAEVAAAHRGHVWTRNNPSRGASVGIWIPLTPDQV